MGRPHIDADDQAAIRMISRVMGFRPPLRCFSVSRTNPV